MKRFILFVIIQFLTIDAYAQSQNDTIEIRKQFGTVYFQHGKKLTSRQLLEITKPNEVAFKEMKIAKTNLTFATIFGFAGGFLVGWPLGAAIGGGDPDWSLAAIGAGLIIVSIPFSISYSKHTKKAVGIYNNGLSNSSSFNVNLKTSFTSNSAGIIITF